MSPAPPGSPFRSWFMAGFESSSMSFSWTDTFEAGREVDVAEQGGHLARADEDYRLAADHGLLSARDALNWRRIEQAPGRFDWSSFTTMLRAAKEQGVRVAWDLCHFGLPAHVDAFAPDFAEHFADYAAAAARIFSNETDEAPVWCPINEISYWAFAGGEHAHFAPHGRGRGHELKRALVRASICAMEALRDHDPRARFLLVDPVMHTVGPDGPCEHSEDDRRSQFEAWDMIAGLRDADLGGCRDLLDIVGVNYYATNQWMSDEARTPLDIDHMHHRQPREIFLEVARRYDRPILLSETGAEGAEGPAWLRYICAEAEAAARAGAQMLGTCIYPVMDYPGWTDGRHCACGLIEVAPGWGERRVVPAMAAALRDLQAHVAGGLAGMVGSGADPVRRVPAEARR